MRQRGDLMQAPPGIDRRPQAEGQALARYPQPCAEHDVAGSSRGGGGGGGGKKFEASPCNCKAVARLFGPDANWRQALELFGSATGSRHT